MRRVQAILYQSLQPAPQALPPPSFDWHRPLTEPVRFLRDPRYRGTLAADVLKFAYDQPAADNANARWHRPLSEPVRFLRDRRFVATLDASGSPEFGYDQPAADNANVRWHRPFAEPLRFRRDPRFIATLDASGEPKWPYAQPAADNANVNWHAPFGEPVWRVRNPRFWAALTVDQFDIGYDQAAADNANARWFAALSEPLRYKRDPRFTATLDASGSPQWPYDQPAADNANLNWHRPLAEPQRFPRDPRFAATFVSGSPTWSYDQAAVDNANVRWLSPWLDPRPRRRWPGSEPLFVRNPDAVAVEIYADSWYASWEIPVRRPARPNGSVTDVINTAAPPVSGWYAAWPDRPRTARRAPSGEAFFVREPDVVVTIYADSWYVSWEVPNRRRMRPSGGLSDAVNTASPSVAGWLFAWPYQHRRPAVRQHQYLAHYPTPITLVDWFQALSEPMRRVGRRLSDGISLAPDSFVSPAAWLDEWSIGVVFRARRRPLADGTSYVSRGDDVVAPVVVAFPDSWHREWSQPNRARPRSMPTEVLWTAPIIFAPHLVPRLGLVNQRKRIVGMINAEGKLVGLVNLRRKITGVTFH